MEIYRREKGIPEPEEKTETAGEQEGTEPEKQQDGATQSQSTAEPEIRQGEAREASGADTGSVPMEEAVEVVYRQEEQPGKDTGENADAKPEDDRPVGRFSNGKLD